MLQRIGNSGQEQGIFTLYVCRLLKMHVLQTVVWVCSKKKRAQSMTL